MYTLRQKVELSNITQRSSSKVENEELRSIVELSAITRSSGLTSFCVASFVFRDECHLTSCCLTNVDLACLALCDVCVI